MNAADATCERHEVSDRAQGVERLAVAVHVSTERTPAALARVYALLGTLGLMPLTAFGYGVDPDVQRLEFTFEPESLDRIDLFQRKLAQFVDCLDVVGVAAVPTVGPTSVGNVRAASAATP